MVLHYVRDPAEIYRQSFAIIRAEADLSAIPADLEKLAVRVIHACGMVDVVQDPFFGGLVDRLGAWREAAVGDLLARPTLVTFTGTHPEREAQAERLFADLPAALAAAPAPAGARRFLVIDVAPLTPALRSFAPLLRQARSLGCTLIVTSQSPGSLEPGLPALFTSHVAFYHFYKRCLRVMAENVLAATGAAETNPSGKPTPINRFGQPLATPVSRMVGKLGDLKVGECFLVTPGAPYEPLRT